MVATWLRRLVHACNTNMCAADIVCAPVICAGVRLKAQFAGTHAKLPVDLAQKTVGVCAELAVRTCYQLHLHVNIHCMLSAHIAWVKSFNRMCIRHAWR